MIGIVKFIELWFNILHGKKSVSLCWNIQIPYAKIIILLTLDYMIKFQKRMDNFFTHFDLKSRSYWAGQIFEVQQVGVWHLRRFWTFSLFHLLPIQVDTMRMQKAWHPINTRVYYDISRSDVFSIFFLKQNLPINDFSVLFPPM